MNFRKLFFNLMFVMTALTMINLVPAQALAQDEGCGKLQATFDKYGGQFSTVTDGLPKYCTATSILQFAINLILSLIGGITIIVMIMGGYQYITSSGNQEMANKGKQTILWAGIGLVVILMAAAIINIIVNAVVNNKLF